jgi:DNA-binding NarL/FixJ family response regulator
MQSQPSSILCIGFSGGTGFARERALSAAGFRVAAIAEPIRAITSARQTTPQVVIIDDQEINDWQELADCLVIASPTVKVVVLVNVVQRLSPTVAALLSKPISPEGLVQVVQAILREPAPTRLKTEIRPTSNRLGANQQN